MKIRKGERAGSKTRNEQGAKKEESRKEEKISASSSATKIDPRLLHKISRPCEKFSAVKKLSQRCDLVCLGYDIFCQPNICAFEKSSIGIAKNSTRVGCGNVHFSDGGMISNESVICHATNLRYSVNKRQERDIYI